MADAVETTRDGFSVPEHIPAELVRNFDIYAPHPAGEDFFASWRRFQETAPARVVWTPRNGGHWIAVHGSGVMSVYEDYSLFSSDSFGVPVSKDGQRPLGALLIDPPNHKYYRSFLNRGLSPKVVRGNTPKIRALTIALIEGFLGRGTCEVVNDFADVLPLSIFLGVVGLPPEDRKMLSRWTAETVRGVDVKARENAFGELAAYLEPVLDHRRGGHNPDMLTEIANLRVDGRLLTSDEAVGAAIHLVMAGLDTVASLLVFVLRFLAEHPEQRRRLVEDPSKTNAAATEFIRRFPIVVMSRRVREDTVFEGVALRTNEMISAPTMLYNLDPEIYTDPLAFDLARKPANIATFGQGIHRCPGAILGRSELVIMLQEWLQRIPNFEIVDEGGLTVNGGIVASMERLDLRWPTP